MAVSNALNLSGTGIVIANGDGTFTYATVTEGSVLLGDASNDIADTGVLAKGSLIVGDGTTAPTILSVGANGTSPIADSTQPSGIKWDTISGGAGIWTPVSSATASSDSSIDFSLGSAEIYRSVFYGVDCSTDPVSFYFRISDDSGSTFETTNYRYVKSNWNSNSASNTLENSNSAAQILLASSVSTSTSNGTISGEIYIYNPSNTTEPTVMIYRCVHENSSGYLNFCTGGAMWDGNAAVTNIRFLMSAGNVATGEFALESRGVTS